MFFLTLPLFILFCAITALFFWIKALFNVKKLIPPRDIRMLIGATLSFATIILIDVLVIVAFFDWIPGLERYFIAFIFGIQLVASIAIGTGPSGTHKSGSH